MAVTCHVDCQPVTDYAKNNFRNVIVSGTTEIELYAEDLATPPDGTFSAAFFPAPANAPDCALTFTFYQSGGREVTRSFTPGNGGSLSMTLTVPDVESITASASSADCSFTITFWEFILHYCRCCG